MLRRLLVRMWDNWQWRPDLALRPHPILACSPEKPRAHDPKKAREALALLIGMSSLGI